MFSPQWPPGGQFERQRSRARSLKPATWGTSMHAMSPQLASNWNFQSLDIEMEDAQPDQQQSQSKELWLEEYLQPLNPQRKRPSPPPEDEGRPKRPRAYVSNTEEIQTRRDRQQQPAPVPNVSGSSAPRRLSEREIDEELAEARESRNYQRFLQDVQTGQDMSERDRFARATTQQPEHRHARQQRSISRNPQYDSEGGDRILAYHGRPRGVPVQDKFENQVHEDKWVPRSESRIRRISSMASRPFGEHYRDGERDQGLQQFVSRSAKFESPPWAAGRDLRNSQLAMGTYGSHRLTPIGKKSSPYAHNTTSGYVEAQQQTPDHRSRAHSVAPYASGDRARGQSMAPTTPINRISRSSSRHPQSAHRTQSHVREVEYRTPTRNLKKGSSNQPRTPVSASISQRVPADVHHGSMSDDGESPGWDEMYRKAHRRTKTTGEASNLNVHHVLPQGSIFAKIQRSTGKSTSQNPQQTSCIPNGNRVTDSVTPKANFHTCSPSTPIRSLPMKDRITEARRPPTNTPTVRRIRESTLNGPKFDIAPVVNIESKSPDETSAEEERQRKHAEAILEREERAEREALQLEIFGEIIPEDEETRMKREMKEREERQRKRDQAAADRLLKEEQKRIAEMEKLRKREEIAEEARKAKELEESKNKLRREAERKKREEQEAIELDRRRCLAEEKIKAERERKAAEAEEREREKQKAEAIQAEKDDLARLKAKQEEAKRQAESIRISKPAIPGANVSTRVPSPQLKGPDDPSESNLLFVSDKALPEPNIRDSVGPDAALNQQDDNRPVKIPMNANQAMAIAIANRQTPASKYRQERELYEAQKLFEQRQKAAQKMKERWESKPNKHATQSTTPTQKASQSSAVTRPVVNGSASFPQPTSRNFKQQTLKNVLNFSTSKSGGPPSICSSQASEATTNHEQTEELSEQKQLQYQKKLQQNRASRRKRATEQAREKKRQELIAEAEKNDTQLTEEQLNAQLDEFLIKREEATKKREATRKENQRLKSAFPSFKSYKQSQSQLKQSFESEKVDKSDSEDDTPEGQQIRAAKLAVRQRIAAGAKGRNTSFDKAAARKTCVDFEKSKLEQDISTRIMNDSSSEESEEDPDDEPILTPTEDNWSTSTLQNEDEDKDASAEDDSDDDNAEVDSHNKDKTKLKIADLDAKIAKGFHVPKPSAGCGDPSYDSDSDTEIIFLYNVYRCYHKDGKSKKPTKIAEYPDKLSANYHAKEYMARYRKRAYDEVCEKNSPGQNLYLGVINWDESGLNGVSVFVSTEPKTTNALPSYDRKKHGIYHEKSWWIMRTVTAIDDEGVVTQTKEAVGPPWTNMIQANDKACDEFVKYLRPRYPARHQHMEDWARIYTPTLKNRLEEANEDQTAFEVEIEVEGHSETSQWLKNCSKVKFEVQKHEHRGPLN